MLRSILIAILVLLSGSGVAPLLAQVAAPCLDRPLEDRPYTRDHLLDVVKSQTPRRAEYLIRTCGVRVPFNNALEKDLREAGAQDNVIAAVSELAPKPAVETKREPPPAPGPVSGASQLDVRVNPRDGLRYVFIPAGTFRMGCSPDDTTCDKDEKPVHDVRISSGFWIGQTAVPVAAYKSYTRFTRKRMPDPPKENPNWADESVPMTMVSWTEAHEYCEWSGLRLPTEAEWEYAARGGTTGMRYGDLDSIAWHAGNSEGRPRRSGQKLPNAFTLYEMLGNVWQWTADWYGAKYYSDSAGALDPNGPPEGDYRVLRGGSWYNYRASIRVSYRDRNPPSFRMNYLGVRCAGEMRVL